MAASATWCRGRRRPAAAEPAGREASVGTKWHDSSQAGRRTDPRRGARPPGTARRAAGSARSATPAEAARRDVAYFPHGADAGIIGRGQTPERAFEAAARAMFGIIASGEPQPRRLVHVDFEEDDLELALVRWLNGLLAESRAQGLALGQFLLARSGDRWAGIGWGEPWRPGLEPGVEVKGATLTMLSVRPAPGGWEARCVVDV